MWILFPNLGLFSRVSGRYGIGKTALRVNDRADDG